MQTQHAAWLAAEKAAGRGGVWPWPDAIQRNQNWTSAFRLPFDASGASFKASLRLSPDAGGATLEDLHFAVGSYTGGYTVVTMTLDQAETALAGVTDGDLDGVAEVLCTVLWTPSGGDQAPFLSMSIPVTGEITHAD